MVYDKCMRLAPWTPTETNEDEETRLLHDPKENSNTRSGLITNLVSQDTYNVMSCVWICHYIWAIPLKVCTFLISNVIHMKNLQTAYKYLNDISGSGNTIFTLY